MSRCSDSEVDSPWGGEPVVSQPSKPQGHGGHSGDAVIARDAPPSVILSAAKDLPQLGKILRCAQDDHLLSISRLVPSASLASWRFTPSPASRCLVMLRVLKCACHDAAIPLHLRCP